MANRENLPAVILANVLPEELDTQVTPEGVRIRDGKRHWTLAPAYIGEGLPADVRRWLDDRPRTRAGDTRVLTARRMSSGARQLMDEYGLSWADSTGSAVIRDGDGLYIARLAPAKRLTDKSMAWSPALAATVEVILDAIHGNDSISTGTLGVLRASEVSNLTGYSYAQTSKTLLSLDDQGYTAKVGAERGPSAMREFREPGRLLSDWAGYYRRSPAAAGTAHFHVPWRDARESLDVIRSTFNFPWVISGAMAADMVAPHLTQVSELLLYVPFNFAHEARKALLGNPEVSEIDSGGRIRVEPAPEQVFTLAASATHGDRVAPIIRIYGDLLRMRNRGEEAADYVRETLIGF